MAAGLLLMVASAPQPVAAQSQPAPQSPAQANDALARQGRFQPPPAPPPPPPLAVTGAPPRNNNNTANAGQAPRRQWREMTDALLDLMAPRALIVGAVIDDPLTTGFGNDDFVEPLPQIDAAQPDVTKVIAKPRG